MTTQTIRRRILAALSVVLALAVLASAASASIAPVTVTLDQSAGTAAGSTANLGMDLKFTPTGTDSVKDLTLALPAGLLANASIDRGACLKSSTPIGACQVGTGTVTATAHALIPVSLTLPTTFDLIAPPKPGDLAGLALLVAGSQLGSAAEITVRPSTDPAGVGLDISFAGIPDTYPVAGIPVPISVDEINSTFESLRLPASCPATPADVNVTADSYAAATGASASAPLEVTGCSSLHYAPAFHVIATGDATDSGVRIVTDLTQTAGQATSQTVALTFPPTVLAPNVVAVLTGGILCTAPPPFAGCTTIGSASATSPLYPATLVGKDYLTGSLTAPAISIVFPAPFSLTLTGAVALATNSTTFTHVPDIPLTDLAVTLAGGPDAVFAASCAPPAGTATGRLTSQNGDKTASLSAPFTVSPCTAPAGSGGGTGGGSGGGTTGGGGPAKVPKNAPGRPRIRSASLTGLAHGRPTLRFRIVTAGAGAGVLAKFGSFSVKLPRGLRFVGRRRHRQLRVRGVSVRGARIRSIALEHGRLVFTLRSGASHVAVTIGRQTLKESAVLRSKARHRRIRRLKVTFGIGFPGNRLATLTVAVRSLHP